ncbi:lateral signaling target protein 2 homolog [Drosophila teissieri]|uniref:lateral signaling target protein 2 homolog n=1 Tax=Drosophila teissieri TaxID=7243 RepID=UPI001CBA480B|nr:lateral signaling target protein 2 homolog [Drosophila teissieri]XP_043658943.1 lateral signaling target protein 2 homolog [Drosophila teissieri]
MSVTSSIEKPTTTATAIQQQQQYQQQQQKPQQQQDKSSSSIAIAAAAGQQQKRKSLSSKRSYSLSSSSASSSGSFGAIRSATSPLVTTAEREKDKEKEKSSSLASNSHHPHPHHHQQQQQSLLPFSYCTDTIAAVHHQRQSYALVQKPPSLRCQGKPHHQLSNFSPTMTSSEPSSPLAADGSGSGILSPSEVASHCCANVKANITTPLATTTHKMHRTIPSDKINLRLILVSGKTKEFIFSPSDSAGDIAQTVFDNWPEDWTHETVSKAEILRLIYQGRFLHCNVTLGALGLPLGKTTVMHLVPRDNLPEPNSQDQRQNSKGGSGRCCSTNCSIL